jgi:transcriptional regulator with XRE-family HTH domain
MLDLQEIRRRLKLASKRAVARASGINAATVIRIANGDTRNPHIETLQRISDALEADPD